MRTCISACVVACWSTSRCTNSLEASTFVAVLPVTAGCTESVMSEHAKCMNRLSATQQICVPLQSGDKPPHAHSGSTQAGARQRHSRMCAPNVLQTRRHRKSEATHDICSMQLCSCKGAIQDRLTVSRHHRTPPTSRLRRNECVLKESQPPSRGKVIKLGSARIASGCDYVFRPSCQHRRIAGRALSEHMRCNESIAVNAHPNQIG
jgi:hypothetical protein